MVTPISPPLWLFDLSPIGTSRGLACVEGRCVSATVPVYARTPIGDELRALRRERSVTIRQAASALGLSASELSAIEFGAKAMPALDWDRVYRFLRDLFPPAPSSESEPQ